MKIDFKIGDIVLYQYEAFSKPVFGQNNVRTLLVKPNDFFNGKKLLKNGSTFYTKEFAFRIKEIKKVV